MGTIEQGVKQAVENCLKIKAGESVIIITDEETVEIGTAFKKAIEKITGKIQIFIMEDFGRTSKKNGQGENPGSLQISVF